MHFFGINLNEKKYYVSFLTIFLILLDNVKTVYAFHSENNNFTTSGDSWWLLVSLIVFFLFLIIEKKIHFASRIYENYIQKFKIPNKIAVLVVLVTLSAYISITYHEIFEDEYQIVGPDHKYTMDYLAQLEFIDFFQIPVNAEIFAIRLFLLYVSYEIFGTERLIPFVISISLLVVVYFLTLRITKSSLSALVAFFFLIQSNLFLKYDTIATYNNFWIFFYLVSLILITNKTWPFSPISFIASIYSKAISVIYFPVSILFTLQGEKKFAKRIFIIYGGLALVGTIYLISQSIRLDFDSTEFIGGFFAFAKINFEPAFLVLLIPMVIILYVLAKKGIPQANTMMLGILLSLVVQPLMVSVFPSFLIHDYRYIAFSVFFVIGISLIFSKNQRSVPEGRASFVNNMIFVSLLVVSVLSLLPIFLPEFAHQVMKVSMS